MAKNSFSWDDLGALNLETGKIEEDKRKLAQKRDRDNNEKIKKEKERFAQKDWTGKPGENNNNRGFAGKANNKYVGAPYNFVPVWDKVAKLDREKSISHSLADSELISGEIDYRITARTPIIISNGNKKHEEFIRNHYGKYAIPGSSMSGLIRNNVQILSQSSLADDIDDYVLMFREVGQSKGTGMNKESYDDILGSASISVNQKQISVLKNVKAGYIENTGNGYRIYHTKPDKINNELGEMNYYVLSERFIFEQLRKEKNSFSYLKEIELQHSFDGYEFIKYIDEYRRTHYICVESNEKTKEKLSMLEKAIIEYREIKKTNNKEKLKAAEGKLKSAKRNCKETLNQNFKPGFFRISYSISNDRISAIGIEGEYDRNGFLMITGAMQEKKALYVIPQMDCERECIEIPDQDVKAFQIDYEGKKNQLKEPKSFWDLPKKGEIKPVFYINLERLYFGFTPHLRLFYKYSVHQGLGAEHKAGVFDYSKSLFGFNNENDSYRSRVSFSDAEVEGNVEPMQEQIITLGNPKPSSYADYLKTKPNGRSYTYNDSDFRIRGIKQYWLREEAKNQNDEVYKDNVVTRFKPLPKDTAFCGKVRFHNLRREELGLLLWAMLLDDKSELNIGKGKPYGYGRIKLDIIKVMKFDTTIAYRVDQVDQIETIFFDPFQDITSEQKDMIHSFKCELSKELNLQDEDALEKIQSIKGLMDMKDPEKLPNPERIRYMDINKREYQNRNPLPYLEKIIKSEK